MSFACYLTRASFFKINKQLRVPELLKHPEKHWTNNYSNLPLIRFALMATIAQIYVLLASMCLLAYTKLAPPNDYYYFMAQHACGSCIES